MQRCVSDARDDSSTCGPPASREPAAGDGSRSPSRPGPRGGSWRAGCWPLAILVGTVCWSTSTATATATATTRPAQVNLVDSIYYTTVTLSTTGYGDIAPVADARPADQRVRHHPAPHRLPGAADRDHPRGARLAGPRDVPGLPVEEADGRARRRRRLRHQGPQRRRHPRQQRPGPGGDRGRRPGRRRRWQEAHADGLAVVTGDATRREVLRRAGVGRGRPGHHHHRPRRLQRAGHPHRPPAQPGRLDRRRGPRAGERRR